MKPQPALLFLFVALFGLAHAFFRKKEPLSEYDKTVAALKGLQGTFLLRSAEGRLRTFLGCFHDYMTSVADRVEGIAEEDLDYRHESLDVLMKELYTLSTEAAKVTNKTAKNGLETFFADVSTQKERCRVLASEIFGGETRTQLFAKQLKYFHDPAHYLDFDGPYNTLNSILFHERVRIKYGCLYVFGNAACEGARDYHQTEIPKELVTFAQDAPVELQYLKTVTEPWCDYINQGANPPASRDPDVLAERRTLKFRKTHELFQRTKPLSDELWARLGEAETAASKLALALTRPAAPKPQGRLRRMLKWIM